MMSDLPADEPEEQSAETLPPSVSAFLQRLYRDPRYLLIDKVERFGRERIAFIEACTIISTTGEVRGQALLTREYERTGRPDGEHPYGEESLVDFHLRARPGESLALSEDELAALREESWQYYVRRCFDFLLGDYYQAREDAEHNLGIWNLIARCNASEASKWSYLKWWPWIERDRAVAQALWDLEHDLPEHAATELYRCQRSIEQFGQEQAAQYAADEGDNQQLPTHMRQHVAALLELLRRDKDLLISLEERFDQASARGDQAEMDRLRAEMIRRAVDEGE
jgi:hypothetical protein